MSPVVLSTFCRADNNSLIIEDKPYKKTGPKMSYTQLYFSIDLINNVLITKIINEINNKLVTNYIHEDLLTARYVKV